LIDHASDPEAAASYMIQALKNLTNLKESLIRHGAPAEMLNHRAIRMHEPEIVLEELAHWIGG
jgi:serine/threonine-protein kinase HipA|tara:strand:+ start:720 stop:908 length:189 start_codon:yes stop_codon:yes gene_type:complete